MQNILPTSVLLASLFATGLFACKSTDTGGGGSGGLTSAETTATSGTGTSVETVGTGGTASTCPPQTGSGTTHSGNVTADTTWAASDGPHIVASSFNIDASATLTIEPCSDVRIQSGGITVNGKLVADGTKQKPITIEADDATKPFSYIRSFGSIDMSSVTLSHGGANNDPNGLGVIDVRADVTMPPKAVLRMVDVTIDGSEKHGVSLRDGAMFTADSTNLVIKNTAWEPIRTLGTLAGSIPQGTYTGNTLDAILIDADNIVTDTTWHDRGVPYRLGDANSSNQLNVGDTTPGSLATLTIESGVTIKVAKGGRILMRSTGTGSAATGGLDATNVVFTSAEATPSPGDWVGLYFSGTTAPTSKLDGVRVEYAGAQSLALGFHCGLMGSLNDPDNGAILVLSGTPSNDFITNTTILASAGFGIDRGWVGTEVDFLATNTFTDVALCKESFPRPAQGLCPQTLPCP